MLNNVLEFKYYIDNLHFL